MKKYILVTGAAGGIGQALIPLLRESGYWAIAVDRYRIPSMEGVTPIICDLSAPSDIQRIVSENRGQWLKELYGIVHLAGIYPNRPYSEYTVELWDQVMNVNVRSLFWLIQMVLDSKPMSLKHIIIASSTAAKLGSRDPAYAASKSALLGLGKSMSLLLQEHQIQVNTVLPGIIDTPMSGAQTEARRVYHASKTLAKRIGRPEEVASVIAFLLSDSSSYMWGNEITINGGMTF